MPLPHPTASPAKATLLHRLTHDLLRLYVSAGVVVVGAVLAFVPAALAVHDRLETSESFASALVDELLITFYLVMWVALSIVYIGLTHLAFTRVPPAELIPIASQQHDDAAWWQKVLGGSGAASFSVPSATVSAAITLLVSQTEHYRESVWIVVLGLASVAGSWAMMVYAYALQYYRLWAGGEALDLGHEDPDFDDFLSTSILTATLHGAGTSWSSRKARRSQRTQVLLAFVFNTVVIAMTVSLIVG